MKHFPLSISLLLSMTAVATAQDHKGTERGNDKNVVQLAVEAGSFETLVAAVKAAGLAETLSGKGPFTIFAPTDAAFAKLGKEKIAELLKPENKDQLVAILTYHVAGARLPAAKVVGTSSIATLNGAPVAVDASGDSVKVAGANVVKTDIMGSNGVIHVIDAVLLPPGNVVEVAAKAGSFSTLLAAAKAAGLAETLATGGPFTVFAPTDEAFAKLGKDAIADLLKPENKQKLATILKYHVVSGTVPATEAVKLDKAATLAGKDLALKYDAKTKTLTVGGAKVVAADVAAKNGVIHVIDTVLLPQ